MLAALLKQRKSEKRHGKQQQRVQKRQEEEEKKDAELEEISDAQRAKFLKSLYLKAEQEKSAWTGTKKAPRIIEPVPKTAIPLLVLDLDHTLFSTVRRADQPVLKHQLPCKPDLAVGQWLLWKRNHLDAFLKRVFAEVAAGRIQLVFWTAAPKDYMETMINAILTREQRKFVLATWHQGQTSTSRTCLGRVKDLKLLAQSYPRIRINQTILVDDSTVSGERQWKRQLVIPKMKFSELKTDDALLQVATYLFGNQWPVDGHSFGAFATTWELEALRKRVGAQKKQAKKSGGDSTPGKSCSTTPEAPPSREKTTRKTRP